MDATGLGPPTGQFRVVDENLTVYECVVTNAGGNIGSLRVVGIVASTWQVEEQHRDEALRLMSDAGGN